MSASTHRASTDLPDGNANRSTRNTGRIAALCAALLGVGIAGASLLRHAPRSWTPSQRMVVDSDDGPAGFDNHACGEILCMSVQLNGLAHEVDIPAAMGRYLIKFGKAVRTDKSVVRPGAGSIRIAFNAFRLSTDGSKQSVQWATADVPLARLTGDRPKDFGSALNMISALQFASEDARATTVHYCGDPANIASSRPFCSLS